MTNFLDQIPTKVIQDGNGNNAVQRQTMMINGSVIQDDPINERTIVSITAAGTQTLNSVLNNGNVANNTIKSLSSPVDSYDAANKLYVDQNVLTLNLNKVLTNGIQTGGKNIDLTQSSYIFSSDGNVIINDVLSLNNNQIKDVSDPTASTDVATKNYVDTRNNLQTLSSILTNGNTSLGQNIIMATGYIKELHNPVDTQDAATKNYVDGYFALNYKWTNITDGTNTASPSSTADTFRFRSTTSAITTTVTNNDGTYGDNLAITFVPGSVTHGSLGSLTSDDHTQYILVNGTRTFTGSQSLGNNSLTNVNTLSGYSGTALSITSSAAINETGTGFLFNATTGQYAYQFAGTISVIESSAYRSEEQRDVAVTSYNQIPSNGILRLVSTSTDRTVARKAGTGTIVVDTIENWS